MVSGRGVFDVSGMKVTRRAARREITPKIASGTWFKIYHLNGTWFDNIKAIVEPQSLTGQ